MYKIGLSTSALFPHSLETCFDIAKNAGYEGLEIMVMGKRTQDIERILELEKEYDLPILSVHAPTLLVTQFMWGNAGDKLHKTVELTEKIGAKTIVVHPPFAWQRKYSDTFFENIHELEAKTGLTIAVENMFPWTVRGQQIKAYSKSWKDIKKNADHITFDFSHAALDHLDTVKEVEQVIPKLSHIHLCDGKNGSSNNEKDKLFDEHLLPGDGNQPIKETFQLLNDRNWSGNVVVEVKVPQSYDKEQKKAYVKEAFDYAAALRPKH